MPTERVAVKPPTDCVQEASLPAHVVAIDYRDIAATVNREGDFLLSFEWHEVSQSERNDSHDSVLSARCSSIAESTCLRARSWCSENMSWVSILRIFRRRSVDAELRSPNWSRTSCNAS